MSLLSEFSGVCSNCEPCLLDMRAYGGSLYKVRELTKQG